MNSYLYVLSVNGLIFFLSLVFYFFPPKKINPLYGYRTHRSMANLDIWKFANTVFTRALVLYAAIAFAGAMLIAYLEPARVKSWIPMGLLALTLLVSIIKTEQALNQHFDKNGERKT